MTQLHASTFQNRRIYIPKSLSEIQDQLGSMILDAPRFIDETGVFPHRNIDSSFYQLNEGMRLVSAKFGEERYAALTDLTARAKALFADDPDDTNGKTDEGRKLLFEIEDLIQNTRRERVEGKLPDDEGRVTGD